MMIIINLSLPAYLLFRNKRAKALQKGHGIQLLMCADRHRLPIKTTWPR